MGIIIPTVFFSGRSFPPVIEKDNFTDKEIFTISHNLIFWIVLGSLSIWVRFSRLSQYYLWPTGDEALHGFISLSLLKKWNWQYFYTVGEHPPLLIWMLAFFLKLFKSTFQAIWFLPALFSTISIPLGYFCCKEYLSKSAAALFVFLFSFSFWPIYYGRFCHQGLFIPFWEFLSFFLLNSWLKKNQRSKPILYPILLGICSGLGTLTFISWVFILFVILVTVLFLSFKKLITNSIWFYVSLAVSLFPFSFAYLHEGYGHHLMDSAGLGHLFSGSHQFITHLSYITSMFWGSLQTDTSYGPTWGGMLNPVLVSCFFIGILGLYQERQKPLSIWIGLVLLVCLIPAFLAGDYVELNRIIQVMPILLFVVVLGMQRLLWDITSKKLRLYVLLGLLITSILLDASHLIKPSRDYFAYKKTSPNFITNPFLEAYQLLNTLQQEKGPGIIFTEFLPVQYGHSLFVSTYSFNSAVNPELNLEKSNWAAIFTNINYQPFLRKRFPDSKWYWLGNNSPLVEGGLAIGIIPVTLQNKGVLKDWTKKQFIFHQLQLEAEGSYNQKNIYNQSIQQLVNSYEALKGDPFIETCYWEWKSQYYFSPTYDENVLALKKAILQGYPAVHLYQKLSILLNEKHQLVESEKAHQASIKMQPKFQIIHNLGINSIEN